MNEHALAVLSGLRDKRQCIFRCGITQQCLSVHIHRWVIYCANTTKPVKLWRHVITENDLFDTVVGKILKKKRRGNN